MRAEIEGSTRREEWAALAEWQRGGMGQREQRRGRGLGWGVFEDMCASDK